MVAHHVVFEVVYIYMDQMARTMNLFLKEPSLTVCFY
jgi:hypothetical protein